MSSFETQNYHYTLITATANQQNVDLMNACNPVNGVANKTAGMMNQSAKSLNFAMMNPTIEAMSVSENTTVPISGYLPFIR